jgi:hypothetical protein
MHPRPANTKGSARGRPPISGGEDFCFFKIILLVAPGLAGYSISSGFRVQELKKAWRKTFHCSHLRSLYSIRFSRSCLVALAMYLILHFDLHSALVIGAIALPTAPVVRGLGAALATYVAVALRIAGRATGGRPYERGYM